MEALLRHPAVQQLAQLVEATPWAGRVWLVGGCVRDALLKRPLTRDFDLVLEGDAVELAKWLADHGAKNLVVYPRFGTAAVWLDKTQFEFVSARKEVYVPSSRKPTVEPGSLLDDARRRDFTCNSLMLNLNEGRLIDLLGVGQDDLQSRILRTPLEPRQTFFDDPLRMLRAVRFRHQLDFEYGDGLENAIHDEASRLQAISAERIRDEFCKLLEFPAALQELADLGLMQVIAPELLAMKGVEQGQWHHLDVWEHTLLVVRNAASHDLILNLACLLHDVGKPATRTKDETGHTRFFSHEVVGAELALVILERLRFDHETAQAVALLVRNHMRLSTMPTVTPAAARRLIRDIGDQLDRLMKLVDADTRALRPGVKTIDVGAIRSEVMDIASRTPAETIKSPISGDEVMKILGWDSGPKVGEALRFLTEQVIEGKLAPTDAELAREMVRRFAE